jgi:uncharacterized membrane protein YgdD (TMEM256/DUF423 family)
MTNRTLQKKIFRTATIIIGIGVILGAFGAHGLKNIVSENEIQTFQTGIRYQLIHAFGILALALSMRRLQEHIFVRVYYLFLAGIVLFSGSLYVMVLSKAIGLEQILNWMGIITPLGGLCFIAGWFQLAYNGYKAQENAA